MKEKTISAQPNVPSVTRKISHQGPIFVDPNTKHVIMAYLELSPDSGGEYEVRVWCATGGSAQGYVTHTDQLAQGLWDGALPVLSALNLNIAEAIDDLKESILTMVGEMDKKTNDTQRILAEYGSATIRQEPPK